MPATKIRIIEDDEASGEIAAAYDFWRAGSGRQRVPGIIKCFGARPDFLRQVVEFSNRIHFSEGHLSRRHKEMIAKLRLLPEPVSILTGQPRLLPACPGSIGTMRCRHTERQARFGGAGSG